MTHAACASAQYFALVRGYAAGEAVRWGLEHRSLEEIRAIGVDELAWKKGHKYLTMVYQIDHGRRRLLHVARERTTKSFNTSFDMLGDERARRLEFVASDMWAAFRNVIRRRCSDAVHVLDRFHVMHAAHEQGHRPDPAR